MTTPDERWDEFFEECIDVGDDERQGAVRMDDPARRSHEANRHREQVDYHRRAVRDHVGGEAPLMIFREGYYVMFHKANEALALAGFKSNSHHCTLMGLRGIFDAPDLANELRKARQERKNVDYAMDPSDPALQNYEETERFVDETVDPFVTAVDELIDDEGL